METTQPTGWHRAEIIAALRKRGTSLAALGRHHGYADSTLSAALMKPATPANQVIASFLGVSLHDLWPDWFDVQGRRVARKGAPTPGGASSQKHPEV
jgi:Ner family transcriptional regulator